MANNSTKLRDLINNKSIKYIMEAHNGISAKIVEQTGFDGIWASGLCMSATLGLRDNNEASWTQVCDICEFMSNSVDIPILLDGDSGFGNFNNFRLLVRKLEQLGIAGVCIEDKLFPKTNSFINGERQELADVDEFCGKIKAGKDAQKEKDFVIVARVEAFIVGAGLEEALKRAKAYSEAGADAILIHSKASDCRDIESFMNRWDNRKPIIVVPTKYYSVPTEHLEELGISLVIWANHNLRACIKSMKEISGEIYNKHSISTVENKVATLGEIFELQDVEEYKNAEKKYFSKRI